MYVTKRNGSLEKVDLNKITERIEKLKNKSPKLSIDVIDVCKKVVNGLHDKVKTSDLDALAAETAASMASYHYDYDTLAARLSISNLLKTVETKAYIYRVRTLHSIGILSDEFMSFVEGNIDFIQELLDPDANYNYDYFGFLTLKRSYLLKDKNGDILETPQEMVLRTAITVADRKLVDSSNIDSGWVPDKNSIKTTYNLLINKFYTHATPTLFNSGTVKQQLSSCFLMDISDDSIAGIYKTLGDCARISQSAGGIGLSIHKIRAKGSYIKGTNGFSNGITPMLRVFDTTARYVDQGGGKRKGSIAIYIEPWHADIFEFLDLKKNHGKEELRARDLFYALWIPDLFMKRVQNDEHWTLLDPHSAYDIYADKNGEPITKYLYDCYGEEFDELYKHLESMGSGVRVKARDLWEKIINNQIETGVPYLLYKDASNAKSNQKNLGTIKSSNLCTEILEYTDKDEIAVCNLASLSLPAFIKNGEIDYDLLYNVTRTVTRNLDNVIDVNWYPVIEARTSNMRHRPVGIGVQGLADLFAILKLQFNEQRAKEINKKLFETIYKGAIDESCALAQERGKYSSFGGSPSSSGQLQWGLWGLDKDDLQYDWSDTIRNVLSFGLRNSLLVAPMPTASTSQILGNNECFEPFTSNLYTRRTLAGDFIVVNKYLIKELTDLGIWNNTIRTKLMNASGSVADIKEIPQEIRDRYKTVWELPMRDIIDMAADRGPFICQSQSMNLFMSNPTLAKLTSMHFYAWSKGLKTGCYYLRTEAARDAIKFTVDKELLNESKNKEENTQEIEIGQACRIDDPDCESCSG